MIQIIKTVKENVPYCGGTTSIWVLDSDGTNEIKTDDYVQRAEIACSALDVIITFYSFILPVMRLHDGKSSMDLLVEHYSKIPVSQEELQKELRKAIDMYAQLGVETSKLEP